MEVELAKSYLGQTRIRMLPQTLPTQVSCPAPSQRVSIRRDGLLLSVSGSDPIDDKLSADDKLGADGGGSALRHFRQGVNTGYQTPPPTHTHTLPPPKPLQAA